MTIDKALLIIADEDEIILSYNERRSLERIAYISSEVPPDEILLTIEVVFVLCLNRKGRQAVLETLCSQKMKRGGTQEIVDLASGLMFEPTALGGLNSAHSE